MFPIWDGGGSAGGVNPLPWSVLADTSVDRKYKPTFPKYVKELDGKDVALAGYMQPLGEELEVSSFMLRLQSSSWVDGPVRREREPLQPRSDSAVDSSADHSTLSGGRVRRARSRTR